MYSIFEPRNGSRRFSNYDLGSIADVSLSIPLRDSGS